MAATHSGDRRGEHRPPRRIGARAREHPCRPRPRIRDGRPCRRVRPAPLRRRRAGRDPRRPRGPDDRRDGACRRSDARGDPSPRRRRMVLVRIRWPAGADPERGPGRRAIRRADQRGAEGGRLDGPRPRGQAAEPARRSGPRRPDRRLLVRRRDDPAGRRALGDLRNQPSCAGDGGRDPRPGGPGPRLRLREPRGEDDHAGDRGAIARGGSGGRGLPRSTRSARCAA